jgi:hypothetical protein
MLIFFDTEFTDLSGNAKLISIGLVDEIGDRTFYVELSDTWGKRELSDFAEMEVLPQLGDASARISKDDLRRQLAAWLATFGGHVQLATDSESWDWIWIVDLFGTPGSAMWPACLAQKPQLLPPTSGFLAAVENAFTTGLRQHHALDDAKANRLAWLATS